MELIRLTEEILEQGLSDNYGWSNKQLRLLCDYYGLNIKVKGWKREILGQPFPKEIIEEFLALKNAHLGVNRRKSDRYITNPVAQTINEIKTDQRVLEAVSKYSTADDKLKKPRIEQIISQIELKLEELKQLI